VQRTRQPRRGRAPGGPSTRAIPTWLLDEARQVAVERMIDAARDRGANAVIGMRFDTSDISTNASELLAYGTAVVVQAKSGTARAGDAPASPRAAA
jgi:hypothetical protein